MARRVLIVIEGGHRIGMLYVQAAELLGLHPITLSADPAQYDYIATGEFESIRVDTGNLDALIGECSRLRATYDVAGITGVGDLFYATVGKLCRYFSLPGPDPISIERCCDKFTQRQLLAEAGVPVPAFRVAANATDVESCAAEIGLPVIIKPVEGTGSRGVRLCDSLDEVAEHTSYLLGGKHIWRSPTRILVEEYAHGPYYSVDTMGNEIVGIAAGEFDRSPNFVIRQFTLPALLTNDGYRRIADVSLGSLRALGLCWGPANIELRWTKLGPVVIEVNPRLAGTPDPQLIRLAYGVDLISEHIKLVIGEGCDLHRRHCHTAAARFLVPDRDGILDRIDGARQVAAVPGVAEIKLYVKPKTPIVRRGDSRDWIGHVIVASPSLAETEAILQHASELIDWSITPFRTVGER